MFFVDGQFEPGKWIRIYLQDRDANGNLAATSTLIGTVLANVHMTDAVGLPSPVCQVDMERRLKVTAVRNMDESRGVSGRLQDLH
jgi:hypothetical protein